LLEQAQTNKLDAICEKMHLKKGGKMLAIPAESDPTPAAQRAVGLVWHNGQPTGVILGSTTDLTHLNISMGYRHGSSLRFLDGTVEYQVGRAVDSAVSGQGWCAGILTATKVSKSSKVFVCMWSKER